MKKGITQERVEEKAKFILMMFLYHFRIKAGELIHRGKLEYAWSECEVDIDFLPPAIRYATFRKWIKVDKDGLSLEFTAKGFNFVYLYTHA